MNSISAELKWYSVALALCCLCVGQAGGAGYLQGRPMVWGNNNYGLTNVPPELTNVVAVAAGANHCLALKSDGTVSGWGDASYGKDQAPAGLSGVVAIAAGGNHSVALKYDGTVVAWGDNSGGQTNVPAGTSGVRAIASGQYHSLALLSSGRVVAWGANGGIQVQVPFEATYGIAAIAAGGAHSLALKGDGRVIGWGQNTYGQTDVSDLYSISAIAAGDNFSLMLRNGLVIGRGNNDQGRCSPPAGLSGVTNIAAGQAHSMALKNDGTVVSWGDGTWYQTNVPAGLRYVIGVSAGMGHSMALRAEPPSIVTHPQNKEVLLGSSVTFNVSVRGSLAMYYQWQKDGANLPGMVGPSLTIPSAAPENQAQYRVWVSNAAGSVVSSNATLVVHVPPIITAPPESREVNAGSPVSFSVSCWGSAPLNYQWLKFGTNVPFAPNAGTYSISLAQTSHAGDYSVVVWNAYGRNTSGVARLVVHPVPVILTHPLSQSLLEGSSLTLSLTASNADTYQWSKDGVPIPGALTPVYRVNHVLPEHAGTYRAAACNAYATNLSQPAIVTVLPAPPVGARPVILWGQSNVWNGGEYVDLQPPAGLSNVVAIAAGLQHCLALQNNGTIIGWGDNSFGQASTPPSGGGAGAKAIAAGHYHSLVLRDDGTVCGWGRDDGQQATVPGGLDDVKAVVAGKAFSLALLGDGTVRGWGDSSRGQTVPPVAGARFRALAAGSEHALGVFSNGTVLAWGANDYDQAQVPPDLSNVVAVAAGENHSVALRSNGLVRVWGRNNFGQLNIPYGLSDVVAVACGQNHTLALRRDGQVSAWGQQNYGQIFPPTNCTGVRAITAGGASSFALRTPPLRLQPPLRLANGGSRLFLGAEDGAPVAPGELGQVQIWATPDPGASPASWTVLTNALVWVDGHYEVDDRATNQPRRFYIGTQTP